MEGNRIARTTSVINELAKHAVVVDIENNGDKWYTNPSL